MNKYAGLYKRFKINSQDRYDFIKLEELEKRATPKRKIFEETCIVSGIDYYICTNCKQGGIEDDDEFCKRCGQDLTADWSE